MLKTQFWQLIDASRAQAGAKAQDQVLALQRVLDALAPDELVSFQHWFDDYHQRADSWAMWDAAFLVTDGCTEDSFIDFRGWLVARGEAVFEAALADPDTLAATLAPGDECQVEGYTYAAQWMWSQKTGKAFDAFPPSPMWSAPKSHARREWDEDQVRRRLPRLWSLFGEA